MLSSHCFIFYRYNLSVKLSYNTIFAPSRKKLCRIFSLSMVFIFNSCCIETDDWITTSNQAKRTLLVSFYPLQNLPAKEVAKIRGITFVILFQARG
jgi:hypothetical protein